MMYRYPPSSNAVIVASIEPPFTVAMGISLAALTIDSVLARTHTIKSKEIALRASLPAVLEKNESIIS